MTGWNVPRPTWSVTVAMSHSRTASRPRSARRHVEPGGRGGDGAVHPSEDRLVALGVFGAVVALDVRGERDVPERADRFVDRSATPNRETGFEQSVVLGATEEPHDELQPGRADRSGRSFRLTNDHVRIELQRLRRLAERPPNLHLALLGGVPLADGDPSLAHLAHEEDLDSPPVSGFFRGGARGGHACRS